jgi:hypothetical protein
VADVEAAIIQALDDDALGERQLEDISTLPPSRMSASKAMASLPRSRLVSSPAAAAQPLQHRDEHAVRMAGEVGEQDLQSVGVFEGKTLSRRAADAAGVDEDEQPVGVLLEACDGGEQVRGGCWVCSWIGAFCWHS